MNRAWDPSMAVKSKKGAKDQSVGRQSEAPTSKSEQQQFNFSGGAFQENN